MSHFLERQVWPLTADLSAKQRWTWMTTLIGSWALVGLRAVEGDPLSREPRLIVEPMQTIRRLPPPEPA